MSTSMSSTIIAPNSPPTYQAPSRAKAGVASKVDESANAMASFRIEFPLSSASQQGRPELITVSGVCVQARLDPADVAEMPQVMVNQNSEAFVRRPLNPPLPGWLRASNKPA